MTAQKVSFLANKKDMPKKRKGVHGKKHKLVLCKYFGYYKDKSAGHIAQWKCPICKRIIQCGMPKDRKTLKIHCDGL